MSLNVTDKASALDFLDRLAADPLNPELCKQFGVEIVPVEVETESPTPANTHLSTPFACGCPRRLHCDSEIPHPACEVCDDCHSGMPATCAADDDPIEKGHTRGILK